MAEDHNEARVEATLLAILSEWPGGTSTNGTLPKNLLEAVDSFGFLQLLLEMSERLNVDFDLEEVDDLERLVAPPSLVKLFAPRLREHSHDNAAP